MTTVALYFDFVSPYSYLALTQAPRFAAENGVRFDLRPVVYAKILDATGLVGPVEVESKRRYTFADILRNAHRLGVPLVGPPAHPFRSLEALRTLVLHRERARVLAEVVTSVGLDTSDLAARIATTEVKDALTRATADAITAGVFGVPTLVAGDEMFWGQDRMALLADFLQGRLPAAKDLVAPLLRRPRGADRRKPS